MEDLVRGDSLITFPPNISNKDIALLILEDWRDSDAIKDMKAANEYYAVRNTGIKSKARTYKNDAGKQVTVDDVSNVRIASGIYRAMVNQKINYALGKPPVLSVENLTITADEQQNDENYDIYLREWEQFMSTESLSELHDVAKSAVSNGIGWAYVWIDENQKLRIVSTDSTTIYPAWADRSHTVLDAVVRDFEIASYEGTTQKTVSKVEFWDANGVERFIYASGGLKPDTTIVDGEEGLSAASHMTRIVGDDVNGMGWGKVPFVALKGSRDEMPLLNVVMSQIDAYDELNSKSTDGLIDDIEPILLMRGVSGDVGELSSAKNLLKTLRIASVDKDGDAHYVSVDPNITAIQQKLEHLRKEIREYGSAVDTQDVKFGSNPSGIALKSMYSDLDIYINSLEVEFGRFFGSIKYFFDIWLEFRNIGSVEQWADYRINVRLDRDMMINDGELIDQSVKLQGMVSQETADGWNPAIINHATEKARREAERSEAIEKAREESAMFRFREDLSEGERDNE